MTASQACDKQSSEAKRLVSVIAICKPKESDHFVRFLVPEKDLKINNRCTMTIEAKRKSIWFVALYKCTIWICYKAMSKTTRRRSYKIIHA